MGPPSVTVRPATSADIGTIVEMIRALAEYEGFSEECAVEAGPLSEHLFGPIPLAEVLIAEIDGSTTGEADSGAPS